jgi:5-methylcytosine-specific restriction endonuclease McrA
MINGCFYVRKPIPSDVKQKVLLRCMNCCEDCGTKTRLEMHHLTYIRNFYDYPDDVFGYETEDDLAALCRDCHFQRHFNPRGDFVGDIDELNAEWDYFNHIMGSRSYD